MSDFHSNRLLEKSKVAFPDALINELRMESYFEIFFENLKQISLDIGQTKLLYRRRFVGLCGFTYYRHNDLSFFVCHKT